MKNIKVIVHTKTGHRLAYWADAGKTVDEIDRQWAFAIKTGGAVTFHIWTMDVANIDYVEIVD